MNKTSLMNIHLQKYGGQFTRKNGRWHWSNGSEEPILVTTGFLLTYKPKEIKTDVKTETKVQEPTVEIKKELISEIKKEVKKPKPKKTSEIVHNDKPIISEMSNENI